MAWMPAGSLSLDELQKQTDEFRERIRADRVAKGQSPESPEDFVDVTLSFALLPRLWSFRPIASKYAKIIAEGTYYPVDTSKLEDYRKYADLLRLSTVFKVSSIACGVSMILDVMEQVNKSLRNDKPDEMESTSSILVTMNLALTLINPEPGMLYYDYRSDESIYEREKRIKADVDRLLSDTDAFQAELDAAWAHYETIKHEI